MSEVILTPTGWVNRDGELVAVERTLLVVCQDCGGAWLLPESLLVCPRCDAELTEEQA